jgi:hypothetical protein
VEALQQHVEEALEMRELKKPTCSIYPERHKLNREKIEKRAKGFFKQPIILGSRVLVKRKTSTSPKSQKNFNFFATIVSGDPSTNIYTVEFEENGETVRRDFKRHLLTPVVAEEIKSKKAATADIDNILDAISAEEVDESDDEKNPPNETTSTTNIDDELDAILEERFAWEIDILFSFCTIVNKRHRKGISHFGVQF